MVEARYIVEYGVAQNFYKYRTGACRHGRDCYVRVDGKNRNLTWTKKQG